MTARLDTSRRPGQPLIALLAISIAWIAVRALAWQSPFAPLAAETPSGPVSLAAEAQRSAPEVRRFADRSPAPRSLTARPVRATAGRDAPPQGAAPVLRGADPVARAIGTLEPSFPIVAAIPSAQAPGPVALAGPEAPPPSRLPSVRRWRVDSWVAWRPGGTAPPAGQGAALAYGASQAGALVRFDLTRAARRPQAYLRAVHAPDPFSQTDLAAGIGVRPLAQVPVRVQAEARATASQGRVSVRPAVLAVSELEPIELPLGLRAEGYAQAGWVGGGDATGFIDGQARLDRAVAAAGPAALRLGAGAWGGAQRAVGRLDVGPTATLDLRGGGIPARLSLDYRHRVLGSARPGSGIAVTLSTGF